MKALCTLSRSPDGAWRIRHSSAALGDVEVSGPSREATLTKMQNELQYRWELCPCSGQSVGTVELEVRAENGAGWNG